MSICNVETVRQSISIITKILANKDIQVTQAGSQAYVESDRGIPVRINIPHIPDNASDELILAINGFLDHEVAHVLFTDFQVSQRESFLNQSVFNIYNAIEDCRIEKLMRAKFAGSRTNLDGVLAFFIDRYVAPGYLKAKESGEERALISSLFCPAVRAWSGQAIFQRYMHDKWADMQTFSDKIAAAIPRIALVASTQEAIALAHEINELIKDKSPETAAKPPKIEPEKEQGGDSSEPPERNPSESKPETNEGENESEQDPTDEEDGESETEDEMNDGEEKEADNGGSERDKSDEGSEAEDADDEAKAPETNESEGLGSESSESESDEGEEFSESESETVSLDLGEIIESAQSDMSASVSKVIAAEVGKSNESLKYRVYSTEFDKIEKFSLDGYDCDKLRNRLNAVEKEARGVSGALQKTLERLVKSKSHVRNIAGKRSGRVNSASLHRLKTGDDRVFKQRDIGDSNDVAVSLVVDCSGSMSGQKIKLAMEGAFALCDVLTKLNVSNEVIGFTTLQDNDMWKDCGAHGDSIYNYSRHEQLHLPIFKAFNEKFGEQQKLRMAAASLGSNYEVGFRLMNNVDGESIRIAAKRLLTMTREKTRQMIVLSDGYPAGYGDRKAMQKDLHAAVKEISGMGVKLIGIGILDEGVKDYYPNHLVINNLDELPAAIIRELKVLLV